MDVEAIKAAGFMVLVDNMWGNGAGFFPRFIGGGTTRVIEFHAERNPIFPEMKRPEPIPPNVDAGLAKAREIGADVVCILDGDADRCGFGDENGAVRGPAAGLTACWRCTCWKCAGSAARSSRR